MLVMAASWLLILDNFVSMMSYVSAREPMAISCLVDPNTGLHGPTWRKAHLRGCHRCMQTLRALTPDAYGPGVGMDVFGRPVYPVPWP